MRAEFHVCMSGVDFTECFVAPIVCFIMHSTCMHTFTSMPFTPILTPQHKNTHKKQGQ